MNEQQQVEEELRALSTALENAVEGISRLNPQGHYVAVNRAYAAMVGYRPEEMIGMHWLPTVHADDQANLNRAYEEMCRQGKVEVEARGIRRDGSIFYKQLVMVAAYDHQQRFIGHHCFMKDISDRKRIEESLRNSEACYRAIVEDQTELICRTQPDWTLTFVNEAYCRYFGKSRQELVGYHFTPLVFEADRHALETSLAALRLDCPTVICEHRAIMPNGEIRWQQWTNRAIFDSEGNLIERQAVGRDITNLKQAEAALRQVNEELEAKVQERTAALQEAIARLQAEIAEHQQTQQLNTLLAMAIEHAGDAIEITNADARIEYVNPAFEQLTGYSRTEVMGQVFKTFLPSRRHDEGLAEQIQKTIAQGQVWSGELSSRHRNGTLIYQEATVSPVYSESGAIAHYIAVKRDVSARVWAETMLHQQIERERLVSTITQRIRQSLNLGEILNTTVAEVRPFLQADRTFIYRFEPDWSGTIVVEAVDTERHSVLGRTIQDVYFAETYRCCSQEGCSHVISDIYTADLSPHHIDFLAKLQIRSSLFVPILQGETLWGLLVANQCEQPRHWQQWETDLLKQLAAQVGIAIHQSELYQQVQQFNAGLESQVQERTHQLKQALTFEAMLKRITDKVRDSLDEAQILQTAVNELGAGLDVDCCDTGRYDLSQSISTICYEYSPSLPATDNKQVSMENFPDLYPQLLQGQHIQFCPFINTAFRSTRPETAVLACPIFDDQGVLGDLWLFRGDQRIFNEQELRLVQQVANQCAIAIRQARLHQAARRQVEELERLNHLKDDFLSTVSHELRSPVSNMKMAIQMLDISLKANNSATLDPPIESRVFQYLQILQRECQREIELINDLLDLQRLEAQGQSLALAEIPLQSWLRHLTQPFFERAANRKQQLEVQIADNVPNILSDASSLERVITELLTNACKYTPPDGSIQLTAEVSQNVTNQNATNQNIANQNATNQNTGNQNTICLSIRNTGTEISGNELARIFDKFYRIPNSDPWKQGGTGLGLALVKKLIEHLGGSIQAESTSGETCFRISLPRASQSEF